MRIATLFVLTLVTLLAVSDSQAAQPTAKQAIALKPVQSQVPYAKPQDDEIAGCTVKAEKSAQGLGWAIYAPGGEILRRFEDTNADNKVDLWRYYEHGLETYRDIDSNFNETADQYRWFGSAGMRWGLDPDEDGKIDRWKYISAQEVTAEVVAALRDKDARRLRVLLPNEKEFQQLGLGKELAIRVQEQLNFTRKLLPSIVTSQKLITSETKWVNFAGTWPGILPADSHDGKKDLVAYENVLAIVDDGVQHRQLPIGTIVQVGNAWRLISAPAAKLVTEDQTASTPIFFHAATDERAFENSTQQQGISDAMEKLVEQLEKVDDKLSQATSPASIGKLNADRAKVLEKLIEAAPKSEQSVWTRQLLDSVGAAVQSGSYTKGLKTLQKITKTLADKKGQRELLAHARWITMSSQYAVDLSTGDGTNFVEVQTRWQEQLEAFANEFPKSDDAGEVMLQLAMAKEFVGEDEKAIEWYTRITRDFGKAAIAEKAAGAQKRLNLPGKPLGLRGMTLGKKQFDTRRLAKQFVLIHYWATWCEPCKRDMEAMIPLVQKYKGKFTPVGICLDDAAGPAVAYLRESKIRWPQLYEQGGLDSSLAKDLGVFTLPVMILIGPDGNVVNRNIHISELEDELKKKLE